MMMELQANSYTEIHDATSGQESGAMYLSVASHDGGTNAGLKLTGGSVIGYVDVEIGRGGGSVTDVQGTLSMGGTATINNSGVIQVAAQTVIDHDQLANFAANEHYTQNTITTVGTIGTGVWNGTAIASAYLDADTAHLSGVQTFTGRKTFGDQVKIDGDHNVAGTGDGAALHIDAHDITDAGTSASGTAAMYTHVNIEAPRLMATNSSVTTTNAASLYINNAPVASTNQTITNAYALWVDAGLVKFDGALTVGGTITGDVTGSLTGQADTVATIAGLAPNTATTQATQAAITTCANLATVGTVTTGVWRGTAVESAYMASGTDSAKGALELATTAEAITGTDTARAVTPAGLKARVSQIVNLKGYAVLQDDVFDYANPFNTDDEAPFQLDVSYGSGTIDSSTEVGQNKLFRSGGFHVPFACSIATIQTQVTCNNAGNVSIAIVEYRPSDASGDQNDYPRTVYETVVNASDDNNNKVDTVTIATGDLDFTAVPAGSHLMMMVKGDGTSAGGTTIISTAIGLSW